jgi:dolichyl-diphosphooligosaccharide--protein glycosyltransferase
MAKKRPSKAQTPRSAPPPRRRLNLTPAWLVLAGALALYLRATGASSLFLNGQAMLVNTDPYYHMRRLLLAVHSFPVIPSFDYYLGFPKGGSGGWPPFFELLAALPALILGLGHPSRHLVELCGAWLPPVIGMATLLWAYLIGRRVAGRSGGIIAAFALAVLWAHAAGTLVGYFDHDGALVFFSGAFFYTLLRSEEAWQRRRKRMLWSFLTGSALLSGTLSWVGFPVFAGIAFCYFLCRYVFLHVRRTEDSPLLGTFGWPFLWAGLALLPFGSFPEVGGRWTYACLSWLQPVLYLGISLFAGLLWVARRAVPPAGRPYPYLPLLIPCFGLLLFLGAKLFLPQTLREIVQGIGFLQRRSPWLENIEEFLPLFYSPEGKFEILTGLRFLSGFLFLWPIALPFLLLRRRHSPLRYPAQWLLAIWTSCLFVMTLAEYRHAVALALPFSITLGYTTLLFYRALKRRIGKKNASRWVPAGVTGLITALLLWPTLMAYRTPGGRMSSSLLDALVWMRDHTPETGHYDEPWVEPEYGVLARWDYGHFITYLARRPVLATNFGTYVPGFEDAARFFMTPSESAAAAILRKNRIRYLLLTEQRCNYPAYIGLLGLKLEDYVRPVVSPDGRKHGEYQTPFFDLVESRLFMFNGQAVNYEEDIQPVLTRFRLVYESPGKDLQLFDAQLPQFKIFEFVPGAQLQGMAKEGDTVEASIRILTPSGTAFNYVNKAKVSPDGRFSLGMPYVSGWNGEVMADTVCLVKIGQRPIQRVRITEEQVEKGKAVSLP